MAAVGVWPMKEEAVTDSLLREFLLGKVEDAERERIESLFLTDSQARERVFAVEQDLIEDYLEGSLTAEDKERFLARYAQTEEQRHELRIARSIKDWAVGEAREPQPAVATVSVWDRFWARLRLRPVFVVPIAVAIVIAVVLAVVWLNSRKEQQRHLAVEQELAQLNSPASLREVPAQMILELRPVTVRSLETPPELKTRPEHQLVELRLPWIKERYATYRAEVRGVGESFTIPNLSGENDGEYRIRLRLPTDFLRRGSYQIQLQGIANDGSTGLSEEYHLSVSQ